MTAGYDRALHAVLLAELCLRDGHDLAAVLVASPWRPARVRALVRQRGRGFLRHAARRLLGRTRGLAAEDALAQRLARLGVRERSLSAWGRARAAPVHGVASLDAPRALELAQLAGADAALYAGGGILRRPLLEAIGGPVLNAHAGPLPAVRGMNACEWSLLLGHAPEVTVHLIDEGIDTGPILSKVPIPVAGARSLDDLRGACVVRGVEELRAAVRMLPIQSARPEQPGSPTRQCFVMAPVLRELAERRVPGGATRS